MNMIMKQLNFKIVLLFLTIYVSTGHLHKKIHYYIEH